MIGGGAGECEEEREKRRGEERGDDEERKKKKRRQKEGRSMGRKRTIIALLYVATNKLLLRWKKDKRQKTKCEVWTKNGWCKKELRDFLLKDRLFLIIIFF